jgi:hypothetical protein
MHIQPAIGRLLAQAKIEEAQTRRPSASVLRAASLERPRQRRRIAEEAGEERVEPERRAARVAAKPGRAPRSDRELATDSNARCRA